jgi:CheY-like chemotaxis protein
MKKDSKKNDSGIKILVVDDNPKDFELLSTAVARELPCTFRLTSKQNDYETELAKNTPDIIICDSNFYAFDGMAALNVAEAKCPEVPFVFCCGYFNMELEAQAKARGIPCILKDAGYVGLLRHLKKEFKS